MLSLCVYYDLYGNLPHFIECTYSEVKFIFEFILPRIEEPCGKTFESIS